MPYNCFQNSYYSKVGFACELSMNDIPLFGVTNDILRRIPEWKSLISEMRFFWEDNKVVFVDGSSCAFHITQSIYSVLDVIWFPYQKTLKL